MFSLCAHGVSSEVDPVRIGNRYRLALAVATQIKGPDSVTLRRDRQSAVRVRRDDVVDDPLGVVKIHAASAVGRPPMEEVQRPERSGKGVARVRNAAAVMVVRLGESKRKTFR